MSEEKRVSVAALLDQNGVKYLAQFVPQSLSRNSASKTRTINWRITLTRGKESMALDYQSGIGNIPGYSFGRSYDHMAADAEASEKGVYAAPPRSYATAKRIPAPHVADICYTLVIEDPRGETFEDWAEHSGYDSDSRAAEETYRACLKQTRDAVRVLGRPLLNQLAELLQDY